MSTLPIEKKPRRSEALSQDQLYLSDEFRFCGLPDVCDCVSP